MTDFSIGSERHRASPSHLMSFKFPQHQQSLVKWRTARIASIATMLVVAAVLVRPWPRRPAIAERPVGDYVSLLSDHGGTGLPAGLAPAWPQMSSGAPALSRHARSVRIGARIADVEITGWARNRLAPLAYFERDSAAIAGVRRYSASVASFAGELSARLDEVRHGDQSAMLYRQVESEGRRGATVDLDVAEAARREALMILDPRFVALGNWLEVARVATLRGDTAFLASAESRAEAAAAVSLPGISRDAREALGRLRFLLDNRRLTDLPVLQRALTDALEALAS